MKETKHRLKYRIKCPNYDKGHCTLRETKCKVNSSCERMKMYDNKNKKYYDNRGIEY